MKLKIAFSLIALFAQMVYSQSAPLLISTQRISDNEVNWETTLTLTVPAQVPSAFLLELPAAIHMIPIAVTLNTQNLWLQNGTQTSDVDSVVTWYAGDQGIIFIFNPDQLAGSDRVQIKTMTTLTGKRKIAKTTIDLRQYSNDQTAGQIIASVEIPVEWVNRK